MLRQIWFYPLSIFLIIISISNQAISQTHSDYLKQGIANLKEENYEEAVEDLKKARELDPKSSIAAYFLGIAYKKVQNYPQAKNNLKDALILTPKIKEAVVELSDVLYQLNETEEALKEIAIAESEGMATAQTSFLKGLVLLKMGKNLEAIELFKKAKSLDQKLTTSADYQIAMANMNEGNLDEAREIFREIVIRDPNADIAQFANQYTEAITKRIKEERPYRLTANIQYQHDDNVILKPSDVTAAGDISGESDSAGTGTLRAEYIPKLRAPFGFKTQYSLFQNSHSRLANFDVQSHTLTVVPSYNFTNGSVSLLTSYNYTRVANLDYLQTFTLSPTWTLLLSKTQFTLVSYKYQNKEYIKAPITPDENRDSIDNNIGISWFYLIAEGKGFLNLRYEFNKEETEGRNWKYAGNKFGLNLLYPLPPNTLTLNLGGEAYLQNYDEVHSSFNKKRDDKIYTFNTMLSYTIYDDIDIQLQYVYIRTDSNISVYGYNKNMVSAGLEMKF